MIGPEPFPSATDDSYYFSLWLYTYESFIAHPEWAIDFVESTFAFNDPFRAYVFLVATQLPRGKEIHRKFTRAAWEWCRKELAQGRLRHALTYNESGMPSPTDLFTEWSVTPERTRPHPEPEPGRVVPWWLFPVPSKLRFAVEFPLGGQRIDSELQARMLELAHTTFAKIDGAYGFINLSRRPVHADVGGTEYERKHGIFSTDSGYFLNRKIRGVFWDNYLCSGHLKALGGIEAVKAHAPCARVEEFVPGKEVLALRITEDVNDVTPEQVAALESYLEPLALRPG